MGTRITRWDSLETLMAIRVDVKNLNGMTGSSAQRPSRESRRRADVPPPAFVEERQEGGVRMTRYSAITHPDPAVE